jgi:hypothetical protein
VYETIRAEGTQKSVVPLMQTRAELYRYLDYHAYEKKLDELFAKGKESGETESPQTNKDRCVTVSSLFGEAGLELQEPVEFRGEGTIPKGNVGGIYVVVRVGDSVPEQAIVYIGCTTREISTRIAEFRRHVVGERAPHAGGQIIKLLKDRLWIYWAKSDEPKRSEIDLLCAFRQRTGKLPFGNAV